jgi:TonB family protein
MQICRVVFFLMLGLMPSYGGDDGLANLKQSLKSQYLEKVVTLRNSFAASRLSFDVDGNLSTASPVGPWTTCSRVEVKKLDLNEKRLTLQGRRILLRYDRSSRSFVDIGKDVKQINSFAMSTLEAAQKLRAEVALSRGSDREDALRAALDRIFLKDTEDIAVAAPPFWKLFLRQKSIPGMSEVRAWFAETSKVTMNNGTPGVVMPRQLSRSLPGYTELARIVRASGIVLISGIIDAQGRVGNLQIINPMGLGLDESAVYEISKWQFEPARLNGQPVAFQAFVEPSFRLY